MKIKVIFSNTISIGDIKAVKAYAKEQKPELEEIVRESIEAVRKHLNVGFLGNFTEVEATYFNSYEKPVISFTAKAVDYNVPISEAGHWIIVEAHKTLDQPGCSAIIYRREK